MRHIFFWIGAARAPFFTGSLAPIVVGTSLAYQQLGSIDWLYAVLALVALILLHASANLANDFFDHLSGNDEINTTFTRPFTGGSRLIQRGIVPAWQILVASLVSMGAGALIGFYLVWSCGWPILWMGVVGGVTGFLYTAPPLRLVYRGIGELFIFLDFGLLPVLGAYYVQTQSFPPAAFTQSFPPAAFAAGVPVGLLIVAVLWINQFQDREADAAVGKNHWVVRLGRAKAAKVHVALLALTFLSIIAGVIVQLFPAWALLALLALPIAAKAAVTALKSYDDLPNLTPANAGTVGAHLVISLLLSLGFVLAKLL